MHRHRWSLMDATYLPPRDRILTGKGPDSLLLQLVYGMTTVTQRCDDCGRYESYTTPGRVNLQGEP